MPTAISSLPLMQPPSRPSLPEPRQRRLSNKLRATIHTACDEGNSEIALLLLLQLDRVALPAARPAETDWRQAQSLAGIRERVIT